VGALVFRCDLPTILVYWSEICANFPSPLAGEYTGSEPVLSESNVAVGFGETVDAGVWGGGVSIGIPHKYILLSKHATASSFPSGEKAIDVIWSSCGRECKRVPHSLCSIIFLFIKCVHRLSTCYIPSCDLLFEKAKGEN
jgi:hypothetical protein